MKIISMVTALVLISGVGLFIYAGANGIGLPEGDAQKSRIYIRTENYPRPPYSGATYYIYERDSQVICTKLEVCNKFDECSVEYRKGSFKEDEDIETGEPYGKTDAVVIPVNKLKKHTCLTKFKLIN
jgi:hypothetical protein